jgi:hypothetical protein
VKIYLECPVLLSISQIFLNKKRRNLKKGETIDRYSFERRNQGGGEQKNGEMGSPRITVCRPRGHQKKVINLQEALELHFEPPCATVIPQLQKITVRAKHLGITYR